MREAVGRSAKIAKMERKKQDEELDDDSEVLQLEVRHLEKILPALLTDF